MPVADAVVRACRENIRESSVTTEDGRARIRPFALSSLVSRSRRGGDRVFRRAVARKSSLRFCAPLRCPRSQGRGHRPGRCLSPRSRALCDV